MKFPSYFSIFRQQEVVQILHELDKLLKQQIGLVASKSSKIKIWEIDDKLRNKALIKKFCMSYSNQVAKPIGKNFF